SAARPPGGSWATTSPTLSLDTAVVVTATAKPASSRSPIASSADSPTTYGTDTTRGPLEIVSVTVVPRTTTRSGEGETDITTPLATVRLLARFTATVSPRSPSFDFAVASSVPTRLGIVTCGSRATTTTTAFAFDASANAGGVEPTTVPGS